MEIGLGDCNNYNSVSLDINNKYGVDPAFDSVNNIHGVKSDEFFQNNNETFDVIFIDGLHHYDQVLEGKPVFITNNLDNKTTVMTKLNSLVDTYLYISRNIDPEILRYLNETEQAVNFYYTVENNRTGIKITFAIIYIIIVSLLLFLIATSTLLK